MLWTGKVARKVKSDMETRNRRASEALFSSRGLYRFEIECGEERNMHICAGCRYSTMHCEGITPEGLEKQRGMKDDTVDVFTCTHVHVRVCVVRVCVRVCVCVPVNM